MENRALDNEYKSVYFSSSVQEIREAALFLREKHTDGTAWTDMTVSVSDMENYAPGIERVFSLYEIPHTIRRSQALSAHLAGNFFEQIQNCKSENFSFDSIRRLLLNDAIPWKNRRIIDALISFGRRNNCLCSYTKMDGGKKTDVDVWIEAFENPVRLKQKSKEDAVSDEKYLRDFYENLKKSITRIVLSKNFKAILSNYKAFKSRFIDSATFDEMPKSDKIISRCISELYSLIELQDEYKINENDGVSVPNCYSFFVRHLSSVQYLEQLRENAVQVYPYRTSAAAPYKIHVVLGSTQDSLSVGTMFKQLSFLSDEKRSLILEITPDEKSTIQKLSEIDPSEHFIHLYQINSENGALFLSSHHSPTGYGFPHGALKTLSAGKEGAPLLHYDPITAEESLLLEKEITERDGFIFARPDEKNAFPKKMLRAQKNAFKAWKSTHSAPIAAEKGLGALQIRQAIDLSYKDLRTGKYKISATSASDFFKCPRRWLFKRVLKLKPLESEAEIIDNFLMGTINHAVLQEYCSTLKSRNLPLTALDEFTLSSEYRKILEESISRAFSRFIRDEKDEKNEWDKTLSFMTKTVLEAQKSPVFDALEKSIASLSSSKKIKGSFVLETEKKCAEYAPEGEDYLLFGTIDCVLKNGEDTIILDYKSGSVPKYTILNDNKIGEEPDFQIPYYTELYERETGENVCAAYFYSIRERKLSEVFDKSALSDEQKSMRFSELQSKIPDESEKKSAKAKKSVADAISKTADFERTRQHCLQRTHDFCEAMKSLDFGISEHPEKMCISADNFGEGCLDYVAVCRMFFTVSGEENSDAESKKEE